MDPPRHGRLRALINRTFGAAALARLEPQLRAAAEQLAASIPTGRTVGFVDVFSMRLPSCAIGTVLGLPASTHGRFRRWTTDMSNIPGVADDDLAAQARTCQSLAA